MYKVLNSLENVDIFIYKLLFKAVGRIQKLNLEKEGRWKKTSFSEWDGHHRRKRTPSALNRIQTDDHRISMSHALLLSCRRLVIGEAVNLVHDENFLHTARVGMLFRVSWNKQRTNLICLSILITCLLDNVWILPGEVRCYSTGS